MSAYDDYEPRTATQRSKGGDRARFKDDVEDNIGDAQKGRRPRYDDAQSFLDPRSAGKSSRKAAMPSDDSDDSEKYGKAGSGRGPSPSYSKDKGKGRSDSRDGGDRRRGDPRDAEPVSRTANPVRSRGHFDSDDDEPPRRPGKQDAAPRRQRSFDKPAAGALAGRHVRGGGGDEDRRIVMNDYDDIGSRSGEGRAKDKVHVDEAEPRRPKPKDKDRDADPYLEPARTRRTYDVNDDEPDRRRRGDPREGYAVAAAQNARRRDDRSADRGYRSDGRDPRKNRDAVAGYDPPRRSNTVRDRDRDYDRDRRDRDRDRDYDNRDRDRDRRYDSDRDRGYKSDRGDRDRAYKPASGRSDRDRDGNRDRDSNRDSNRDLNRDSNRYDSDRDRDGKSSKAAAKKKGPGFSLDTDSLGRYYEQGQKHYKTVAPIINNLAKMYMDSKK